MSASTSQSFFDAKYRRSADPWAFASSSYEQQRYASMLGALQQRRYSRAFEPGCSIGVLTSHLATLCDEVMAADISPVAVGYARERCRALTKVTIACGKLPAFMPDGKFDLIVFSEIGYYFEREALRSVLDALVQRLSASGVLLATHWLGRSPDHLIQGDDVHEMIGNMEGITHTYGERHAGFRLDRWRKP